MLAACRRSPWDLSPQTAPAAPSPHTVQGGEPLPALALHEVRVGEKYYLALFMTGGAVQLELLGCFLND
jgi:hypothetical protein